MKRSLFFSSIISVAVMVLTLPAFAGGAGHTGYVAFADPVQINGKQLPAGEYKLTWDGDGPSVNLHVLRGGKEVASAPATLKQLDAKAQEDAAETKTVSAGSRELTGIRFSGKKYELQLGSTSSQAEVK
jgi:hypothetical protein